MPMLVLLAPIIACYLDIARPSMPHFHYQPPPVYVIDFQIKAGTFGGTEQ